ncbi:GNAT family N-acetyltransferase [Patescibacteria group bacterium]|nr:GNAT family N-acetyltransferase [Patescibacteria group bacterium]
MDLSKITIQTERLLLVPISSKFRKVIFKELTKEITKYMFPQPTGNIKDTDNFLKNSVDKIRKGEDLIFAITNPKNGEFLGCIGLHHLNQKSPELGIWLKKDAHGYKYGQEAMRGVKNWADKNLTYSYLKYPVAKANVPSRKVAESLGGKVASPYILRNQIGEECDGLIYRIPHS